MEDQIRKRIDEIKSDRDKLQDVFNQRFPDYVALSKPQPLSVEQTQALLANDEALVAVDLHKKSYVWVITKDRAKWKELSASADDVSKEVKTLRDGLNPESPKPFDHKLAYKLYLQVLGPIEETIAQKKRLSFVLDGALTSLPPQVLITSDPDGKDFASIDWLIRKYAVTVLPSTASLKVLRGEQSTVAAMKPLIGFGDPIFDRTMQTAEKTKVAALNRSLTSFYRGVTVDTKSLAIRSAACDRPQEARHCSRQRRSGGDAEKPPRASGFRDQGARCGPEEAVGCSHAGPPLMVRWASSPQ
jgi:hypothetical protein